MHSKNTIWFILLIIFLILGGLEIYMWNRYNNLQNKQPEDTSSQDTSLIQYNVTDDLQSIYDLSSDVTKDTHTYIFLGDSRYVSMSEFKSSNDTFICENGVGRDFFENNMEKIISLSDSNTRIIVGLGVNDLYLGVEGYVTMLKTLSSKTDAEIYYMTVNPVKDATCQSVGYNVSNADIDTFNQDIINALTGTDIKVIDTYSFLIKDGFISYDGLHYDEETTLKIYQYIKVSLNN